MLEDLYEDNSYEVFSLKILRSQQKDRNNQKGVFFLRMQALTLTSRHHTSPNIESTMDPADLVMELWINSGI